MTSPTHSTLAPYGPALPDTSCLSNPGAADFAGKRVAVVGIGKSGEACLRVLAKLTTAHLAAFDSRESALESITDIPGIELTRAEADPEDLAQAVLEFAPDIVVPAPGIPGISPLWRECRARGIEIDSEIELAWRLRACDVSGVSAPWLAVTGTNGKTTTVSMAAAMLERAGLTNMALGNIGTPAITEVTRCDREASKAFVLELSSFQLTSTHTMEPWASVCMNIDDDHLEWHGSREAYWAAKARVYAHCQQACLFPIGEPEVQAMVDSADVREGARAIALSLGIPSVGQIGVVEDAVVERAYGLERFSSARLLFTKEVVAHLGIGGDIPIHILKDAMAAAALAASLGIPGEDIAVALRGFQAGAHRIQTVANVDGVAYVDDSKATNAHAVRASMHTLADGHVVWIAGGIAKGTRFNTLVEDVLPKLRAVVVIGKEREPWHEALDHLQIPVVWTDPESTDPMGEAVHAAHEIARPGDVVLMAPACASFDQFASYADRGNVFTRAARSLPHAASTEAESTTGQ